jgi:plastocyanin
LSKEIVVMPRFCHSLIAGAAAAAVCFSAASASAAGWGSITGRFVYDGAAPVPAAINANKDPEVCGKVPLMSEDLVVGNNGGIANVVVWVRSKVKVNPKYQATAADKVELDNKNCRFVPHVVGVRVGQTLTIKNSDPVAHNTKIDGLNLQVNPLIPVGTSSDQSIDSPETLPAPVSCSIHNWMSAKLVVRPNPYFAISDEKGNFEIKDLPVGELEFQIWHEHSGYVQKAQVNGENVSWLKGRVTWTIKADETTKLGDMKIAP